MLEVLVACLIQSMEGENAISFSYFRPIWRTNLSPRVHVFSKVRYHLVLSDAAESVRPKSPLRLYRTLPTRKRPKTSITAIIGTWSSMSPLRERPTNKLSADTLKNYLPFPKSLPY